MKKVKKELTPRYDKLDYELSVGDVVAYCESNTMKIGIIRKFFPVMTEVSIPGHERWTSRKYAKDLVRINDVDATRILLQVK